MDFYLDYLSANNSGLFLPTSIKSYLDGRLGQLEERLSSLAFGRQWSRTWWLASWRMSISSVTRISAGAVHKACKT